MSRTAWHTIYPTPIVAAAAEGSTCNSNKSCVAPDSRVLLPHPELAIALRDELAIFTCGAGDDWATDEAAGCPGAVAPGQVPRHRA